MAAAICCFKANQPTAHVLAVRAVQLALCNPSRLTLTCLLSHATCTGVTLWCAAVQGSSCAASEPPSPPLLLPAAVGLLSSAGFSMSRINTECSSPACTERFSAAAGELAPVMQEGEEPMMMMMRMMAGARAAGVEDGATGSEPAAAAGSEAGLAGVCVQGTGRG